MKKLIIAVLIAALIPVIALADVDLASMKFDELVALQKKIVAEIMSRPEWKEVTIPAGNWEVGKDIPVGFYSITATDDISMVRLEDKDEHFVFYKTMSKDEVCGKAEFAAGSVLYINKPVILAPVVLLGF
jgi:hypothetical protein